MLKDILKDVGKGSISFWVAREHSRRRQLNLICGGVFFAGTVLSPNTARTKCALGLPDSCGLWLRVCVQTRVESVENFLQTVWQRKNFCTSYVHFLASSPCSTFNCDLSMVGWPQTIPYISPTTWNIFAPPLTASSRKMPRDKNAHTHF